MLRVPALQPVLSVNAEPEGQHLQGQAPLQAQGQQPGGGDTGGASLTAAPCKPPPPKARQKLRYYAKLFVNGKLLDTSDEAPLSDDFVVVFKDTFRCASGAGSGLPAEKAMKKGRGLSSVLLLLCTRGSVQGHVQVCGGVGCMCRL